MVGPTGCAVAEDQADLFGFGQAQGDPDREQVAGGDGVLARVLHRRHHDNADEQLREAELLQRWFQRADEQFRLHGREQCPRGQQAHCRCRREPVVAVVRGRGTEQPSRRPGASVLLALPA